MLHVWITILVIIRPKINTSQVIKHIGYNTDPYLLTDYCVANISWEYIYNVTIMIKKLQKMDTVLNDI
jgi:hypothetical protein